MQLTLPLAGVALTSVVNIPGVLAAPKVRAVPLTLIGCSQYPLWQGGGGVDITGNFELQIVQTSGKPIEGFFSSVNELVYPNGTLNYGSVTFPSRSDLAKIPYRCTPQSAPYIEETYSPGTVLQISGDVNNATIVYPGPKTALKGTTPLLPYSVYDNSTGKQYDGTYLGGYSTNAVTWAVKLNTRTGAGLYNYYSIRLLGPRAKPLCTSEFTAFIRLGFA